MNGLESEFGDHFTFLRLNAADEENARIQQSLELRGHPTLAIIDGEGKVVQRYFGPAAAETLRAALRDILP